MVEQLGLAMILSFAVNTSAFTSGTTSGFAGSILQAEELSITVIPASANFGAHSNDVLPPAEKIATAGLAAIPSVILTTLYFFPLNSTSLPTLLSDATGTNSVTGKFLSARTCNILVPTNPVAPTTATFIFTAFGLLFIIKKPPVLEGLKLLYDHIHNAVNLPSGMFCCTFCMFLIHHNESQR